MESVDEGKHLLQKRDDRWQGEESEDDTHHDASRQAFAILGPAGSGKSTVVQRAVKKVYEKELAKLQSELVKMQYWVKQEGLKVVCLFEGRALLRNVKGNAFKPSTPNLGPLEPPRWLGRTAMVLVTALALHTDYTHQGGLTHDFMFERPGPMTQERAADWAAQNDLPLRVQAYYAVQVLAQIDSKGHDGHRFAPSSQTHRHHKVEPAGGAGHPIKDRTCTGAGAVRHPEAASGVVRRPTRPRSGKVGLHR